ncbi:MAG: transglutaminase domain-containing protein, partial [Verrucomicrobiae bacterium]|nr:transglutaminase domain-containing protein [Verrucomicrobiae bacterium]
MKFGPLLDRIALSLVLLLEALISKAITGTALHEALLLVAVAIFMGVRWIGPATAHLAGIVLATMIGVGGWWLLERGEVPVLFSDLPVAFHLAVGLHVWAWAASVGARRSKTGDDFPEWNGLGLGLNLGAAAMVVWSAAGVEIYGASVFVVRAMAVGGLALVGLMVLNRSGNAAASGAEGIIMKSATPNGRTAGTHLAGLLILLGFIWLGAWMMDGTERLANAWFQWVGRRGEVTELADFAGQRPVMESGINPEDGAMHDLPKRADIRPDSTVRFHVKFDDLREFAVATRQPLYFRSTAMPIFAGDGRMGPRRQGRWLYDSDDGAEDGVTRLDEDRGEAALRYWVLLEKSESGALPLMAGTKRLGVPGVYAFADGWFQLALEEHQEHVRFLAESVPVVWSEGKSPGDLVTAEAPADYRSLPKTALTDRIRALAAESLPISDAVPLNERLAALRNLLDQRCEYSLRYENPRDLEPVENFLFAERKGHCELFSASTVLFLRAMGIPSRVASGYAGGETDPSRGLIAFRQFDYHSWAEIYVKEHGWIVFDTTPAGAGAAHAPRPNPRGIGLASFDPTLYENLGGSVLASTVQVSWLTRWIAF